MVALRPIKFELHKPSNRVFETTSFLPRFVLSRWQTFGIWTVRSGGRRRRPNDRVGSFKPLPCAWLTLAMYHLEGESISRKRLCHAAMRRMLLCMPIGAWILLPTSRCLAEASNSFCTLGQIGFDLKWLHCHSSSVGWIASHRRDRRSLSLHLLLCLMLSCPISLFPHFFVADTGSCTR